MKRIVGGVVVIVVGVAIAIWQCGRGSSSSRPGAGAAQRGSSAAARGGSGQGGAIERPAPAWFAVRGAPARRIAGRVVLEGRPVANAVVTLHSVLTAAKVGVPVELRTGADGVFDFGLRPAAIYDVTAAADGATAAIVHLDSSDPTLAPPSDQLVLRLAPCPVFVAGTISDAAGNAIAGARVLRAGLVGASSDASGAYKVCVPSGEAQLEFGADGYGAVTLTIDARGEMHRDVVLVPEAAVVVRVLRAADLEPVPDAHVYVLPTSWGPERARVATGITDEAGRVRIAGLVPGRYRVSGFADGLHAEGAEEVHAQVGIESEVVLRLAASARIHGRVVSAGRPVAGAHVTAVRKSPASRSPPAYSQRDGSFVLEGVPVGEVVFLAPPYEVVSPPALTTKVGERHDVVLEVRALGAIRGRVTRLGKPVEGVEVCCVNVPGAQPSTRSGPDGRYEFTGVPAGTYDIGAGDDAIGAFVLGVKVTLGPGEEKVVDRELDQAGTIAGTVVDRDGKPVPGVFVRWVHEKTADVGRSLTDAKGRYRCGAMTGGGRYQAAVFPAMELQQVPFPTADGAPYPALEVKDASTVIENVELAIDRPDLAISGRVVDDTGAPVADAVVKGLPTRGGTPQFHSWLRLPMTSTDSDGKFVLRNLSPGNYALSARSGDGAEGITPLVPAGSKTALVRIERAGVIEGKLVGFVQPPLVYARPLGAFSLTSGVVDGGTFRVSGLRPARYLVNAQTTYEGDARIVELHSGETVKLTLTARGRGVVEGTVLDFRTRAPIVNATCHAVMAVDGEQTFTSWDPSTAPRSDARGQVRLDPAPAGTIDVNCEMPSFRWSRPSTLVSLEAGGIAKAELLSVELAQENPGAIGIAFDWRTTPPRIAVVAPNSAAAKAGLLVGDLVVEVDDVSVKGLNGSGVQRLIASTPIGNDVRVRVSRGTTLKTFTARVVAD